MRRTLSTYAAVLLVTTGVILAQAPAAPTPPAPAPKFKGKAPVKFFGRHSDIQAAA